MSFNNIKSKAQEQGFTIVELLIVVVVIAILAAITIVSYNGITNRANGSAATAMAATVQKKAEFFASDSTNGKYPAAFTDMTATTASGASYYLPGVNNNPAGTITKSTGTNTVQYKVCGVTTLTPVNFANITGANGSITGGQALYYDYAAPVAGTLKTVSFGQTADSYSGLTVACFAQ